MGHKIEAAAITDHEIKSVLAVSSSIKKEINQNVLATKTPKKYITILKLASSNCSKLDSFIV